MSPRAPPCALPRFTPAQVFDKVKSAVVVVKTLDVQGEVKAQGSGVLISSCRNATNCHVVGGGASFQVGRGKQLLLATLLRTVALDPDHGGHIPNFERRGGRIGNEHCCSRGG